MPPRGKLLILILVPAILGAIMWLAVSSRGGGGKPVLVLSLPSCTNCLGRNYVVFGVTNTGSSAACFGTEGLYSLDTVEFLVTKENLAKLRPRSFATLVQNGAGNQPTQILRPGAHAELMIPAHASFKLPDAAFAIPYTVTYRAARLEDWLPNFARNGCTKRSRGRMKFMK